MAVSLAAGESFWAAAQRADSASGRALWLLMAAAVHPFQPRLREDAAKMGGLIYLADPVVAAMVLRQGLAFSPRSPQLLAHLTLTLIRAGDFAQARETFARLQAIAPAWPETQRLAAHLSEER